MHVAPTSADEDKRLACLTALDLLDTPPEPAFERVVRLAQALSGAPIALVSLVDRDRQWFKARRGLDVCETSRDVAFCSHAILGSETLWVEDARVDPRFHDNPLVTGGPSIRFYAGAPITLKGGERLGTVCVIGPHPRRYEVALDHALADLAAVIADDCALRLAKTELAQANATAATANQRLNLALDIADLGVWELVYAEKRLTYHRAPRNVFDWRPGFADIINDLSVVVHDEDRERVEAAWRDHLATGAPYRCEYRIKRRDGKLVWVFSACELVKDAQGRPERVVGVMHDVTEHRRIIDALAAAREAAEAASEAKSQFLADMSQEFRTPLNGVLGLSGALARTKLTPQQAGMVRLIERSG